MTKIKVEDNTKDNTKGAIIPSIAVVAIVLVIGILYISSQTNTNNYQNENQNIENNDQIKITNTLVNKSEESNGTCSNNKVYFIYADWCPHCRNMKPMITQLENEGYEFIKINIEDKESIESTKDCLANVAQLKYIPEFVCIGNKNSRVGAFSNISEMRAFVQICNSIN